MFAHRQLISDSHHVWIFYRVFSPRLGNFAFLSKTRDTLSAQAHGEFAMDVVLIGLQGLMVVVFIALGVNFMLQVRALRN